MTTIRTFIAVELPDEARTALADLQNRLKNKVSPKTVRWTRPQNIHLTLHFLGDVAKSDIDKAAEALQRTASEYPPFSLHLSGLGCFPNMRRPRVVWAGVTGTLTPLVKLHRELGQRLQIIDFKPESRPYSPHLTIGRVKRGLARRELAELGAQLEQAQSEVADLAPLPVRQISLIKSELKPTGAVYTPLAHGLLEQDPG